MPRPTVVIVFFSFRAHPRMDAAHVTGQRRAPLSTKHLRVVAWRCGPDAALMFRGLEVSSLIKRCQPQRVVECRADRIDGRRRRAISSSLQCQLHLLPPHRTRCSARDDPKTKNLSRTYKFPKAKRVSLARLFCRHHTTYTAPDLLRSQKWSKTTICGESKFPKRLAGETLFLQ